MNDELIKKLIIEAKKGDAQAFGQLYSEYSRDLYRFALYYLKNEYDAEDAVQDAALAAFRNIRSLKKNEAFKSWFFKILSNECKKHIQKKNARREELTDDGSVLADSSDAQTESFGEIFGLLDLLPEKDREIVTLSVINGCNSKEISEITGMKAVTVRSRLSRALHKLREEMSERCPE